MLGIIVLVGLLIAANFLDTYTRGRMTKVEEIRQMNKLYGMAYGFIYESKKSYQIQAGRALMEYIANSQYANSTQKYQAGEAIKAADRRIQELESK